MKRSLLLLALATAGAHALAADVGVSVQISQPGVYGRIDIGRFPQPVVVTPQPVYGPMPGPAPAVVVARPEPIYMWVPPGHQKKWSRYCGRYHACGVPVHFVDDRWYREHVLPERGHGKGEARGHSEDHGHGHGHDERGGDDRR